MYNEQLEIEAWENEGGLVQEVTETEASGARRSTTELDFSITQLTPMELLSASKP